MDPILIKHRKGILEVARKYGASNVRVFGSAIRDEMHSDSDIDFLVTFDSNVTLFDLGGLHGELKALVGREVDVVSDSAINKYIRDQILSEAKPL